MILALFSCLSVATPSGPFAAFALLDPQASQIGLAPRLGRGRKHPRNPLWGQDTAWENRIDNGYVDVVHDPNDPLGAWRLWYTAFVTCEDARRDAQGRYVNCGGGHRQISMLYATSRDGLTWTKPEMGIQCYVPGTGLANCSAKGALKTNIVMPGVIGTSVFVDPNEPNASRKFKAVGAGVLHHAAPGKWPDSSGGVCSGPDGLHFPDCIAFDKIENVHWDTWDNIFW